MLPPAGAVGDVYALVLDAARRASASDADGDGSSDAQPKPMHSAYSVAPRSYAQATAQAIAFIARETRWRTQAQQAAVDMLLTHNVDIVCLLATRDAAFVEAQQAMSLFLAGGAPSFAAFLDFFLTVCAPTSDALIASLAARVRGVKCNFCYCLMHRFRTVSAFAVFTALRALWRRLPGAPAAGPYATFSAPPPPQSFSSAGAGAGAGYAAGAAEFAPGGSSSAQSSVALIIADVTAAAQQRASVQTAMKRLALWRDETDDSERWRSAGDLVLGAAGAAPSSFLLAIHFVVDSDKTQTIMECIEERQRERERERERERDRNLERNSLLHLYQSDSDVV